MLKLSSRIALASSLLFGVLNASPAPAAAASNQVPFSATFSTVDTLYTAGCPSPVCFRETGTGTGTHVGLLTSSGIGVVTSQTLLDPTHVTFTINEEHTLLGANGDSVTMRGTSAPIQDLANGTFVVPPWQYTIASGTGRFAGATGGGMNYGSTQLNKDGTAASGAFTFTGTISTVGSGQ